MTEPIRGSRPTETAVGRDHGFLAALWRLPQLGLQQRCCLGWDPPGEGPKARLRFYPEPVAKALTSRSASERSWGPESQADKPQRRPRKNSQPGQTGELLPIKEVK